MRVPSDSPKHDDEGDSEMDHPFKNEVELKVFLFLTLCTAATAVAKAAGVDLVGTVSAVASAVCWLVRF